MNTMEDLPQVYMSREDLRNSKFYQYLNHPIFRDIAKLSDKDHLDLIIELETWIPPKSMQEVFTYKFAGYDPQNRPIWIMRLGTCPIREILQRGEEETLERYFWQATHWVAKSIVAKSIDENPSQQAVFVVEANRVSKGILHPSTLAFMLRMSRKYKDSSILMSGLGIGVNMNKFGVIIINLIRPIIPQTLQNVELYGTDDKRCTKRLMEIFDRNEIPDFAGTERGFYRILVEP